MIFYAIGALLAGAMSVRLGFELHRLLFVPDGPIDLLLLHGMIPQWFQGIPFYQDRGGIHPPAMFVLLWPLYGWGSETATRWVFALAVALAAAGFGRMLVREAGVGSDSERVLLSVLIVGCYPAAITVGNGQITFFVLFAAIAGVLVCLRRPPGGARDALLSGLFLVALIKPHLTLPFFWVIAFSKGWLRPAATALASYAAITLLSVALHGVSIARLHLLLQSWYARTEHGLSESGYGNVHAWLGDLDRKEWVLPASALIFALHGAWAWRHRRADRWVLLGVAAIVARIWAYHRAYDDLLLIVPLIALFRLARAEPEERGAWALFAAGAAALVAPVTPILAHASWALVGLWLVQLAYLLQRARRSAVPATGPGRERARSTAA